MSIHLTKLNDGRVIKAAISGKLHKDDYKQFEPMVEELIEQHGKVNMLVLLEDFEGWDIAAMWEDVKFDAKHFRDLKRIAIVGESHWQERVSLLAKPFTKAEIRYFGKAQSAEAEKWVTEDKVAMVPAETSVVAVYSTHIEAEAAVKILHEAGFDFRKLSIAGRDFHTEENAVGFYNTGDRMKAWGKTGAFWGGVWGFMFGGVFLIPGFGSLAVAGAIVSWIVGALEGAAVVGGISAIAGGLVGVGVPKDSVVRYENALKADKFLLIVHGSAKETGDAKVILEKTGSESLGHHI